MEDMDQVAEVSSLREDACNTGAKRGEISVQEPQLRATRATKERASSPQQDFPRTRQLSSHEGLTHRGRSQGEWQQLGVVKKPTQGARRPEPANREGRGSLRGQGSGLTASSSALAWTTGGGRSACLCGQTSTN